MAEPKIRENRFGELLVTLIDTQGKIGRGALWAQVIIP
jgi:hypothetical protein